MLIIKPATAISSIATRRGTDTAAPSASAASTPPKMMAVVSINPRRGCRPRNASVSAPVSEPTPSDDIKMPKPPAPMSKSRRARSGTQTLKFMPKTPMIPTSAIGTRTAEVART